MDTTKIVDPADRCYVCKRSLDEILAHFAGESKIKQITENLHNKVTELQGLEADLERKFVRNYQLLFLQASEAMDLVPAQVDALSFSDVFAHPGVTEWVKSLEKVMPGILNLAKIPQSMVHVLGQKGGTIGDMRATIGTFVSALEMSKVTPEMVDCIPRWDEDSPMLPEVQDARRIESVRVELLHYRQVKDPPFIHLVDRSMKFRINQYGENIGTSSSRQKGGVDVSIKVRLCSICAALFG